MDPMEEQELLTEVVRALVDNPHVVQVHERRSNGASHMIICVDAQDRGKVIGRSGATMRAMRVLFGRIAAVEGRKIFLHVEGDERCSA
jgi:predicted RNA-binding protein YlqC (UPF0109 family)